MQVFYSSDGEQETLMPLADLINNFQTSDAGVDVIDMAEALTERGWFSGSHDFGQFLVLSLDKFALMPEALDALHASKKG